jgi:hypothetical protein
MVQVLRKPQTEDLLQHIYPLLLARCLKDADRLLCHPNGGWLDQLDWQTDNALKTGRRDWPFRIQPDPRGILLHSETQKDRTLAAKREGSNRVAVPWHKFGFSVGAFVLYRFHAKENAVCVLDVLIDKTAGNPDEPVNLFEHLLHNLPAVCKTS